MSKEEKRRDRLRKAGALAGGAGISASFYKAAMDDEKLTQHKRSRDKFKKDINKKYDIDNKQALPEYRKEQRAKRDAELADYDRKAARDKGIVRRVYEDENRRQKKDKYEHGKLDSKGKRKRSWLRTTNRELWPKRTLRAFPRFLLPR